MKTPATPRDGHRSSILVVEDSPLVSMLLTMLLREAGYAVTAAASGVEALRAVEHAAFDLLVVDIQMPDMDGLTLLDTLRLEDGRHAAPALMLTTSSEVADMQKAMALGARGFLNKPFKAQDLVSRVRRVLSSPELVWMDDCHCVLDPARAADRLAPGAVMAR